MKEIVGASIQLGEIYSFMHLTVEISGNCLILSVMELFGHSAGLNSALPKTTQVLEVIDVWLKGCCSRAASGSL